MHPPPPKSWNHKLGLAWLCARSGLILTVGCWTLALYNSHHIEKPAGVCSSLFLRSLVPMVDSQLANKRRWHQSCIVMAEEGKLRVTESAAQTESPLLTIMTLSCWRDWVIGPNRKSRLSRPFEALTCVECCCGKEISPHWTSGCSFE